MSDNIVPFPREGRPISSWLQSALREISLLTGQPIAELMVIASLADGTGLMLHVEKLDRQVVERWSRLAARSRDAHAAFEEPQP